MLRSLVSEEISIRNLRSIFESILEFSQGSNLNQSNDSFQNNHDYLIPFVRSSLKRQICFKYSKRSNVLVVFLLEPEIETRLLEFKSSKTLLNSKAPLDIPFIKNFIIQVRHELGGKDTYTQNPIILTKKDLRSFIREIIAPECPKIAVISYNELLEDLNIQPMGIIKYSIIENYSS